MSKENIQQNKTLESVKILKPFTKKYEICFGINSEKIFPELYLIWNFKCYSTYRRNS